MRQAAPHVTEESRGMSALVHCVVQLRCHTYADGTDQMISAIRDFVRRARCPAEVGTGDMYELRAAAVLARSHHPVCAAAGAHAEVLVVAGHIVVELRVLPAGRMRCL